MLELLEILAECEPLVLALEDVHWADRSTRAFIAFAARSLRQTRVLLLLSYRTDELHRRHPLRPLLSELERLDRARRIDLRPFDRDELSEVLTDILGSAPDGLAAQPAVRAQRGQSAVHRGAAGRGHRRPRRRAAEPARRVHRADRAAVARRPADRARRVGRPRARRGDARRRDRHGARRRPGGAARGGRRAGADPVRRDRLRVPPRAAARGAARRPAAGRALGAASGARASARARLRASTTSRSSSARRRSPATTRRPAISRRRCARRSRPRGRRSACSRSGRRPTSPTGRSSCGRASRIPSRWPGSATSSCWRSALARTGTPASARARRACCARRCVSSDRPRTRGATPTCWRGCHGRSGCSTRAPRPSPPPSGRCAILPDDESAGVRSLILAWLARMRLLRGNFQDAVADGEPALELAVAAGDRVGGIQPAEHARDGQGPPAGARRGGHAAAPRDRRRGRGRGSRRRLDRVREPGRHARAGGAQPRGAAGRA